MHNELKAHLTECKKQLEIIVKTTEDLVSKIYNEKNIPEEVCDVLQDLMLFWIPHLKMSYEGKLGTFEFQKTLKKLESWTKK